MINTEYKPTGSAYELERMKRDLREAWQSRFTDVFGNIETNPAKQAELIETFHHKIDHENMKVLIWWYKRMGCTKPLHWVAYDIIHNR